MLNKKLLTSIIVASFVCGVTVGHYITFPYNQIQTLKTTLLPSPKTKILNIMLQPHYSSNMKLFDGLSNDYDIVFLGDSITNRGQWSEAFLNKRVANRRIEGDTSEGILNRIDQILALHPSTVYIMCGINDISRGSKASDIFKEYKKIIKVLVVNNIKVIIQSTLFTNRDKWNAEVSQLNKYLIAFSKTNGYEYIDLNKTLVPSGILTTNISEDGVHLKAVMYLKWFDLIKRTMH